MRFKSLPSFNGDTRLIGRAPPPWPKLFFRVYEAFDAGEMHRRADKSDDPISELTNPEIAEIVREL